MKTALVLAIVISLAPAPVTENYYSQRLRWEACDPETPRLECATIRAPRDWHRPHAGPDITLAISRLPATAPAAPVSPGGWRGWPGRRGVLLLDGGGPASNLDLPEDFADKPIAAVYDLIGYDPRGIGRSSRIACLTPAEIAEYTRVDMRDRSPANIARIQANSAATADACARRSGDLLRYITTDQIVRDWDLIRALLREPKLNFLGFSAGTWFGAHYATTFPHRVGRMVLDSNTEFTATMQVVVDNQPPGFERRFTEDFLPWIAARHSTYGYGTTAAEARNRWEARRAAMTTPADLDNLTLLGLYHKNDFPLLAQILSILERLENATPEERALVDAILGSPTASPDTLAMYLAITCNDTPWTRDPDFWLRHSAELGRRYPLQGYQILFQPCAYWPYQPPPPQPVDGKGAPTILMVNSVGDPATPYPGALRAHRGFGPSRLVTILNEGDHISYGRNEVNPCVDDAIHGYLIDGLVPGRDMTCPSVG
ncbi:MAG TPA: alpha/beta hydrolase [Candidatus Limnocylindrales bacterium]|nr:alpha/beta hydrolase [Candidatus Limnocylindrales bacterium]